MLKQKLLLYLFVVLCLMNSCNYTKDNKAEKVKSNLLGKSIFFPETLLELRGCEFLQKNIIFEKNRFKMISIVDGVCPACIENQLNKMSKLKKKLGLTDGEQVFILNVNSADSSYFMRMIQPLINTNSILLWDSSYQFELQNDILTDDVHNRTFLVDCKGRIVLCGNPILEDKFKNLYQKKLRSSDL